MDIFTLSSPLALSCMARFLVEGNMIFLLVENLVVAILIQLRPSFWNTLAITFVIFIGLAFYETRAEYMNPEGNVREINQENSIPHGNFTSNSDSLEPPHSLATGANSRSGMCPVAKFKLPACTKNRSSISGYPVDESDRSRAHAVGGDKNDPKELYGKAIIFPCDLRHRRIAPFKDNFRHSYIYCGMPVGLHACYSPIFSVDMPHDTKSKWPFRRAWFNLRAQDHAIRGGAHMTMAQKLREYLISEGADPNEWAYAYMIAVPSINGQVDNPLGFWYLYTASRELTAIIPELNTSYGERRMWLVRQALPKKLDSEKKRSSPYAFRGHFGKDIHVSPFMPSSGGYTIDTCDPCASPSNRLDILVTLTKDEGGPLLVTRVTSSEPGLDVSAASIWEKLLFLARWCYVPTTTVMTYRILSQAARIYLKAPRYWTRPEPKKTALGKPARAVEMTLERSFRLILKAAVERYPSPISVTYITPGEHSLKSETFHSLVTPASSKETVVTSNGSALHSRSPFGGNGCASIDLQVISPIFYSRFFHYRTPQAAITSELLDDARTRTLWSSDPAIFASIFNFIPGANTAAEAVTYPPSSARWQWWLLSLLRIAPIATNYPRSTPYEPFKGLSSMDYWVLAHCSPKEVKEYRRAILRIFIGEWIGGATMGPLKRFSDDLEPFGLSRDGVLRIYDAMVKATIVAATLKAVSMLGTECNDWIIGAAGWMTAGVNLWACLKASV